MFLMLKREQERIAQHATDEQSSSAQMLAPRPNSIMRAADKSWRRELPYRQEPRLPNLKYLDEEDEQAEGVQG